VTVGQKPTAKFSFSPLNPGKRNLGFQFNDESSQALEWRWDFGGKGAANTPDPEFSFPGGGKYQVKQVVRNGACRDSIIATIEIAINELYYVPNAFSPNGDQSNEVFNIYGLPGNISNFSLRIYSRWGQLVFETSDPAAGWKGQRHNSDQDLPNGTYLYSIRFSDETGKPVKRDGEVNLLR
jgi:gliding motility-associated-like protein